MSDHLPPGLCCTQCGSDARSGQNGYCISCWSNMEAGKKVSEAAPTGVPEGFGLTAAEIQKEAMREAVEQRMADVSVRDLSGLEDDPPPDPWDSSEADALASLGVLVAGGGSAPERLRPSRESEIAQRFGVSSDDVRAAIHAAKREARPRAGERSNPDVLVDDDGEIYPLSSDGARGDSIGNLYDFLPGD